jgi:hypothetical protein
MTYQQIINKVPCPTCGAARGNACGSGAGRVRTTAHDERRAKARGSVMQSSNNIFWKMLGKLGVKK